MLGLFLLYFIGKSYFELAKPYNRNAWLFAIVGIVVYYVGVFIGGFAIGLFYVLVLAKNIDNVSNVLLAVMAMPFGLLACWGLYVILKRQWTKAVEKENENILDSDFKE